MRRFESATTRCSEPGSPVTLADWKVGEWCTIPAGVLGLGTIVLGLPGTGKTETLLRLAEVGLAGGYDCMSSTPKFTPPAVPVRGHRTATAYMQSCFAGGLRRLARRPDGPAEPVRSHR